MTAVLRGNELSEKARAELFRPQIRIHTETQFGPGPGPGADKDTDTYDDIRLSYGLGWGLFHTGRGWAAFKEGHGDGFQHYSLIYPQSGIGVLLMSNSDNAESVFGQLLAATIAERSVPLAWEGYAPIDRATAVSLRETGN